MQRAVPTPTEAPPGRFSKSKAAVSDERKASHRKHSKRRKSGRASTRHRDKRDPPQTKPDPYSVKASDRLIEAPTPGSPHIPDVDHLMNLRNRTISNYAVDYVCVTTEDFNMRFNRHTNLLARDSQARPLPLQTPAKSLVTRKFIGYETVSKDHHLQMEAFWPEFIGQEGLVHAVGPQGLQILCNVTYTPITAPNQKGLDQIIRVANMDYKSNIVGDVTSDPHMSTNLSATLSVTQPSFIPPRSYDLSFVDHINDVTKDREGFPIVFPGYQGGDDYYVPPLPGTDIPESNSSAGRMFKQLERTTDKYIASESSTPLPVQSHRVVTTRAPAKAKLVAAHKLEQREDNWSPVGSAPHGSNWSGSSHPNTPNWSQSQWQKDQQGYRAWSTSHSEPQPEYICSVHRKTRTVSNLITDGNGGYKCTPRTSCIVYTPRTTETKYFAAKSKAPPPSKDLPPAKVLPSPEKRVHPKDVDNAYTLKQCGIFAEKHNLDSQKLWNESKPYVPEVD